MASRLKAALFFVQLFLAAANAAHKRFAIAKPWRKAEFISAAQVKSFYGVPGG